jgi:hypothetical protein
MRDDDLDRNSEVAADPLPILKQLEKKPYTQQTLVRLNRHCKEVFLDAHRHIISRWY